MRTIFLDRDGVINENRDDYVKSWREFRFLPGALDALRTLTEAGFCIFVVTNQAMINRGLVKVETLDEIHRRMVDVVHRHGGLIRDVRYCPHRDDEQCTCRKPQPGMLRDLAETWHVELTNAYMVGDALTDIAAGQAVGCRSILVRTGRGAMQARLIERDGNRPDWIADDLRDAVYWVLRREGLSLPSSEQALSKPVFAPIAREAAA